MNQKYDCILSFQPSINIFSTFLNLFIRNKLINVEMSISHPEEDKIKRLIANLSNYFCGNIICNSYYQKKYLDKEILSPKNVKVIGNGFDLSKFKETKTSFKKTNSILIIGRVSYPKNGLRVIKALKEFYKNNGYVPELNWVGRNDKSKQSIIMQNQIHDFINKNNFLKSKINFLGEVNESFLESLFLSSDCLISASIYEGMPNVICEAMLRKLPIIASKVSDNKKLLGNNERGLLCDPYQIDSICNSIEMIYRLDNYEIELLVNKGYTYATNNFSIEKITGQYLAMINHIVKSK